MAATDDEDAPLEDLIVRTTRMIEKNLARPDADHPEQRAVRAVYLGLLAVTHLDLYQRHFDVGALHCAVRFLEEALAAAPDHPVHVDWQLSLLLTYNERAARLDSLADRRRAIHWARRHLGDPALPESDRPLATCVLMDALWQEHETRVWQEGHDATALDDLVDQFSALTIHGDTGGDATYTRLMTGLGHLERFLRTQRREDLDRGIDLLSDALANLPTDTPRLVLAGSELAFGYHERYLADDDIPALDLAIDAGEQAVARLEESGEDPDMLYIELARAYASAWNELQRPTDLDRAIECWRMAREINGSEGWIVGALGDCLRKRADRDENPADLQEAIPLLQFAVEKAGDLLYSYLCDLGCAYHSSWRLAATPGSLRTAVDTFDRALAAGVPDGMLRALAEIQRAEAGDDLLAEDPATSPRQHRNLSQAFQAFQAFAARPRTPGPPDGLREIFAAQLALAEASLWVTDGDGGADVSRLGHLLELALLPADEFPEWAPFRDAVTGAVHFVEQTGGTDITADMGVGATLRAAASPHLSEELRKAIRRMLQLATLIRGARAGDLRTVHVAGRTTQDPPDIEFAAILQLQRAALELTANDDLTALQKSVEEIAASLERAPSSGPEIAVLPLLLAYAQTMAGAPQPDWRSFAPALGANPKYATFLRTLAAHVDLTVAEREQNPAVLRRLAGELAALAGAGDADDSVRLIAHALAAHAAITLARPGTDPEAAARAVIHAAAALDMTGGEQHPFWARWAMCQAEAARLMEPPDLATSRALGLRALRSQAWRVLAQSGTDYASESARSAAEVALTVARWCVADGDLGAAMTALDAGRGLMLWSATASRQIADQLTAAGRADLAADWRETQGLGRDQVTGLRLTEHDGAGDEVPDLLRQKVVRALLSTPDGPLNQVPLEAVCAAMSTLDADALVYLVPGDGDAPGTALIAEASGELVALVLPGLRVDNDSPASGQVDGGAYRDARPVGQRRAAGLDEVCRWAWTAAMADVVAHTKAWRLGRPARLVLVPMGALGRVPWHAARHGDRFVVQDLVVSYNVSARMLCEAAAHPVRGIRSALIVGDPEGNLPFAGIEARAVHRRFYPHGAYYGSGAEDRGTPDEVLRWITTAASGPSLLSFACHGWADPGSPADTHLVLAGGTLAVRRILEASRLAALEIDRVFLAACATNAGGDDHDEACSLAAAFLASGTHTAFGSLWPVPDRTTSLLMFLVHHHLEVGRCAPADALHRAQLWMLDPDRRPPDGMPAELRAACAHAELAQPASWAAFTHMGR